MKVKQDATVKAIASARDGNTNPKIVNMKKLYNFINESKIGQGTK